MVLMFNSTFNGVQGGLWGFRADFVIDVNRLQRNGSRRSGAILPPLITLYLVITTISVSHFGVPFGLLVWI